MRSRGYYFQYAKTDLGRIFERKYAEKYFPERKSPNQGTKMVADENNYRSSAPHHAKTSECQRAGHKKRGAGGVPPRLFASGLSLEKAWIPRPGPGGKPTPQVLTCAGPPPSQATPGRSFFVKSFEIHCVFLANFDKKCYPKSEERETSPEGHRNHRRPQERRGTG